MRNSLHKKKMGKRKGWDQRHVRELIHELVAQDVINQLGSTLRKLFLSDCNATFLFVRKIVEAGVSSERDELGL